ncbi:hypothetical protein QQX98_012028 [Neonectria punicea]|uniref:3'-5' exonuclease domain-containing protein n=1 Tax=Neonectria punicea TaxID=979145 RepID=A0ABR1GJY3_9HYPO
MPDPNPSPSTLVTSNERELGIYLSSLAVSGPLYIDLEGQSLSRNGTIDILTIFSPLLNVVFLVDVATMGASAFTKENFMGVSLQSILEDPHKPKYFWDVRNDADALWALYGVNLSGIVDVQLFENASRVGGRAFLSGLAKAIQSDAQLGIQTRERWLRIKKDTKVKMGGNVFAKRPLEDKIIQYCANDVIHLPRLMDFYGQRITEPWRSRALTESQNRVVEARSPTYNPDSPSKARGPWETEQNVRKLVTLEEMVERLENARIEQQEQEVYGYYDDADDSYSDDGPKNAHEGAFDSEAFYSCWDKN